MPPRPLNLLLVAEDDELREGLVEALEHEQSIGTVRTVSRARPLVTSAPAPDVILVDAGPPAPELAQVTAHAAGPASLTVVLASEWGAETRELAEAVGAVAYVRKDAGIADITPVVVALASLSIAGVAR
jgi:DNA-binding NarL/FixJ family response regulator